MVFALVVVCPALGCAKLSGAKLESVVLKLLRHVCRTVNTRAEDLEAYHKPGLCGRERYGVLLSANDCADYQDMEG